MSAKNPEQKDSSGLLKKLESLKIVVSQSEGGFTANTYSEPLFCFERPTLDALKLVVADTISSYAKHFGHASELTVTVTDIPDDLPVIPIQRIQPTSRLKPSVKGVFPRDRKLAVA